MVVLALDTTTRTGTCALVRDGVVVRQAASDPAMSAAEHLPGDLIDLLAAERVGLETVDVFAVAVGPGSFTGLRVGIATMQGLAFATGKALIGVSTLDVLAHVAAAEASTIATWVDAWRGEVYAALYQDGREIEPASVEHPAAILGRLPAGVAFVGEGAANAADQIRAAGGRLAEPTIPLLAGALGQLAHARARAGERPGPGAVRPLYVRRTEAERVRDARYGR